MSQSNATPAGRRGRPRKAVAVVAPRQFPGKVILFKSRPRLKKGDLVELCRGCMPTNRGKLAIVEELLDEGRFLVRSLLIPFDTKDPSTGVSTGQSMTAAVPPENLYRLDNSSLPEAMRRIK